MAIKIEKRSVGYYKRSTRPVVITYGSELVDGSKLSQAYPFVGTPDRDFVYSGEPMIVVNTGTDAAGDYGIVYNSVTGANKSNPVSWAFTDSDAFDVVASGKLKGIPVEDKFEIATPFFDHSVKYNVGDKLVVAQGYLHVDSTTGDSYVDSTPTGGKAVGMVTIADDATEGELVVGTVTRGVVSLQGNTGISIYTEGEGGAKTVIGGQGINGETTNDGMIVGGQRQWTEDTGSKYVLVFETNWGQTIPAKA